MLGEVLDYKKHLRLPFGQHRQVHEEETPRNSMKARTKGAISLGPSGDLQGGYRFMALDTGKKITRRNWNVIPTPELVIACVNMLGKDQPKLFTFTDRHGCLIGDAKVQDIADNIDNAIDNNDDIDFAGVDPAIIDHIEIPGVDDGEGQEYPTPQEIEIIDDLDTPSDPPPIEAEAALQDTAAEPMPQPEPRQSGRVKMPTTPGYIPSMTGSKYSYAVTQLESLGVLHPDAHMFVQDNFYQSDPDVVAMVMTQLSLKAGLKEWGDSAWDAAHNEMKQLYFRDTFKPLHWLELSHTQRQTTVLESHMFLKEKQDGSKKGRTVASGNKQQSYSRKEDASSPTVLVESVLLTCIVDAEEGRDVAVIDIPNAFIQTRVEEEKDMAFIKIRGILVDILVDIAPDVYKAYVTKDKKGVAQLLVQCQNAIYGTMVASLLCYRKFAKSLTSIGFVINPYDLCVANKMVRGKQITICWHVDDLKVSHVML
jgi:hypothetical protein